MGECLQKLAVFAFVVSAVAMTTACSDLGQYQDPASVTLPSAIHYWAFDGSGLDTGSLSGWPGTLEGAASYTSVASALRVGSGALAFTGAAGDGFSFGSITLSSELTLGCWVNWTSGGAAPENTILANSVTGASTNGLRFYVVEASGQIKLETGDGVSGASVSSVSNLTSGTYAHVTLVVDGSSNQASIYINGLLNQSGLTQPNFNLTAQTAFGAMVSNVPAFTSAFNGDLDDCKLYNQALSAAQVALLYGGY
jgi:hypothetical protein